MKRDEVKAILPDVTDDQLARLMALHGADIEAQKQAAATLTAERDAARTQLDEANGKLAGYDPDWKAKAAQAENDAKAQVDALKAGFAAERAAGGLQFSSPSARKAFLADLAAQKLPLQEDGSLLGFDDFAAAYRKTDPAAFAAAYPDVKDGGEAAHTPAASARDAFAAWFEQATK